MTFVTATQSSQNATKVWLFSPNILKMGDLPNPDGRKTRRRKRRRTAGLWVDANLAAKLRGGRGPGLADQEFNGETQRLLHYADIALGTKEPDTFNYKTPSRDPQKH